MTVRAAAKYLRKSPQFVDKWVQRYKETKCVDDLPDRGSKKSEDRAIMRLYLKNPNFFLRKGQALLTKKEMDINILTLKRRLRENNVAWRSTM